MATPIELKYSKLGGSTGFLGAPTLPSERTCPDGRGRYQHFQGGSIYWTPERGAFEVHGFIRQKWEELGWERSFLGYPVTDEQLMSDGVGRVSEFEKGGQIVWSSTTGAHPIAGSIGAKWAALNAEAGFLGYPIGDESATPDGRGRYQHFQGGSIYYRLAEWGAFEVHGLIRDRWTALGWEQSFLGFPVSDELPMPESSSQPLPWLGLGAVRLEEERLLRPMRPVGRYSVFEHGVVTWFPGQSEAVESPHHYERLYAQIRAQILARFFALGPKGRRNHFSMVNYLAGQVAKRPVNDIEKVKTENGLWRITRDGGENPMAFGSHLYMMLAVEHHFGNDESTRALKAGLATLESLFVWQTPGDPSSRLPIRWDAGMPDEREDEQFVVDNHGHLHRPGYPPKTLYSTGMASTNINHFPRRDLATLEDLLGPGQAAGYKNDQAKYEQYRPWELSMDEVNGLVSIYWIVNKLSHDANITSSVQRQAQFLGNYLANNGYILVRPMGGLSWRGATGILPALEYPFARVLSSIAGINASSRADFKQAMERAGYWRNLVGPITKFQLTAWTLGLPAAMTMLSQGLPPSTLSAAAAVYVHNDCFDVSEIGEPALALLCKDAPNKQALYGLVAQIGAVTNTPGTHFHPWIGLTGLDDPDPTVREIFHDWYDRRSQAVESGTLTELKCQGIRSIFTTAVDVLTRGDSTNEQMLVEQIERAIVELFRDCYFEPKLYMIGASDFPSLVNQEWCWLFHWDYYPENGGDSTPYHPMNLCVGLALAFWYAKRRQNNGTPVTTPRFPVPLNADRFANWPLAAVPKNCLDSLITAGIPVEAVQGTSKATLHAVGEGYPLFDEPLVHRNALPQLDFPPATTLMCELNLVLPAKFPGDLPTGIMLYPGLEVEIQASGSIWAGDIRDARNGPNGLDQLIDDARWPLHTGLDGAQARAFCLLGRVNGYFYVGENFRARFTYSAARPLFLRINDNNPGDGDGEFAVHIRIWGPEAGVFGRVYWTPNVLRDGGLLFTEDAVDRIDVKVDQEVVPSSTVEFRLETPDNNRWGNITWRKEVIFRESPAKGRGIWTIATQDDIHSDENIRFMNQMRGALLTFNKMKEFGRMSQVLVLDASEVRPGSRITFFWYKD
ncbi:MAG: hypothetical protein WD751_00065 [Anaerolineales bacterium]